MPLYYFLCIWYTSVRVFYHIFHVFIVCISVSVRYIWNTTSYSLWEVFYHACFLTSLLFRGMHVADHGKNRFSFFFIVRTNCKVSQYWLRKTFIDDFFFQANQWKCTSSPSFNQFSSSKERFLAWSSSLVSFIFIYLSIHLSSIFNKANRSFA